MMSRLVCIASQPHRLRCSSRSPTRAGSLTRILIAASTSQVAGPWIRAFLTVFEAEYAVKRGRRVRNLGVLRMTGSKAPDRSALLTEGLGLATHVPDAG